MIELKQLSIGYQFPLAEQLNLCFQTGKITALLGSNGCGKTTLLKTILGILGPFQGEIFIQNRPHITYSQKELASLIGYVPQAHHGIFAFRVLDVVLMGRTAFFSWFSSPKLSDIQVAQNCLARLGILALQDKIYTQLSGGERQLVLIARALAQQPQCLIMDEPTSNLDFGNQIRVLEQIVQLKQQGLTIIFTTHQPEQAFYYTDQVVLFHQGKIMAQGFPQNVMTIEHLSKIYHLDKHQIQRALPFLRG